MGRTRLTLAMGSLKFLFIYLVGSLKLKDRFVLRIFCPSMNDSTQTNKNTVKSTVGENCCPSKKTGKVYNDLRVLLWPLVTTTKNGFVVDTVRR